MPGAPDQSKAMYNKLLGDAGYAILPAIVRELHEIGGVKIYSGEGAIERDPGFWTALLARILGLPAATSCQSIRVVFEEEAKAERWTRHFAGVRFVSRQWLAHGRLRERYKALEMQHAVLPTPDGLHIRLAKARLFGLPLPRWLRPSVTAFESTEGDYYHYDVCVRFPGRRRLFHYFGRLRQEGLP